MLYQKELFGDNQRMSEDTRPVPYSLRLEPDTRAKLEELARNNGRSLNAQIIMMLEAALQGEPLPLSKPTNDNDIESIARRVAMEVVRTELARMSKAG